MNDRLTPELESLIHQKVNNRRYTSASEVVRQALRRMEQRDQVQDLYKASMREKIAGAPRFLAATPGAGHRRDDLTDEDVRFWPVLPYLIAYDPAMRPIGIARVPHVPRDLAALFHRPPPRR
jgi:putative addiction module CopG family antidote